MHRLLLFFLILSCIQACQLKGTPKSEDKEPGKEDMYKSFNKHRSLLIIYGSQDTESTEAYLSFAQKIQSYFSGGRRPIQVKIQSDESFDPKSWKELPSLLIGTTSSHKLLRRIVPQLPFMQSDSGFIWRDKNFDKDTHSYQLSFYPNPDSIWTPLSVISGNSEQAVLSFLKRITDSRRFRLWRSLPFQIYEGETRVALGDFDKNWRIDKEVSWYFDPDPQVAFEEKGVTLFQHNVSLSKGELEAQGTRILDSFTKIKSFLNHKESLPKVSVSLYGSPELMGMMENEMLEYVLEEEAIHKLVHPYFQNKDTEAENKWALQKILGKASFPALENGLAIYFAPNWQYKGYEYWTSKLYRAGDWQSVSQLLSTEFSSEYDSFIVKETLAGSLVAFLLAYWGKETFIEKYKSWSPEKTELKKLNKKWMAFLDEQADQYPAIERKVELPSYLKGMTFANEGYSIYNGYGSTLARKSLEEIRNHHVNMVSIIPYSGSRETQKPTPFRLTRSARSENDISVVFASKTAQELGMKTMMKPQIWFGRSWPGDVEMQNEQDWNMFFAHYRRWILHYVLLAEIHEFDILCLGTEFVKATGMHPEFWEKLAGDMRKIFSGKITYAANWGEEIENLSQDFAAKLDFIGVDCYYPLSSKKYAQDEELKKGFSATLRKLEKISKQNKKPIIFTEVGFRSIPKAWIQPHAAAPDEEASEEDQARCYRIVLEAMKGQDWQVGMFWWKWPSYMDYSSRSPQSFSPAGKEAAKVLKDYYGKMESW